MPTSDVPQPAPSPIVPPPNFPVTWADPTDVHREWMWERQHCPDPVTPMTGWYLEIVYGYGNEASGRFYGKSIRSKARRINTYFYWHYSSIAPDGSAEEQAQQLVRAEELTAAAIARLAELWNAEFLPEIERHFAAWEAFDLHGASLAALLNHLDESITRARRLWEIHHVIGDPALFAMSMFDDLYRDLFGAEHAADGYRLLQGFSNLTIEAEHALWDVRRKIADVPDVRHVLATTRPADVPAALAASPHGQAFLADLRAFLDRYGRRSNRCFELGEPSWIEDPTPVIKQLQSSLARPARDPRDEMAALAIQREQALALARERLLGYPKVVIDRFEALLQAAQAATVIHDDHNFWLDQRCTHQLRQVLLECGRRLAAADMLEQPDNVFFLMLDELRESMIAEPRHNRRPLVAGRRAEMEYFRTITPPALLGTPPRDPSPETSESRAGAKYFGEAPQISADPQVLRGGAASGGIARGPARVLRSLDDAGRLQAGDVLVTVTTTPPWALLFTRVAALITDTGGILSHTAVVAREYGIPAVVGAGNATTHIKDGQIVEVDGGAGTIRIISAT
jgi:pyruvate,water dikinase